MHGDKPENLNYFSSVMKNHFLKIIIWYDKNYVPEKISHIHELKQYLADQSVFPTHKHHFL